MTYEKHNKSGTRIYKIWADMKKRCYNPNNEDYVFYGAKGITVSEEWLNSFNTFYADMISTYTSNMTIDRIDSTKGYSKDNCRWLPILENVKKQYRFHAVVQFDMDGNKLKVYPSQREAARCVGVSHVSIGKACRGVRKKAAGYIWKYVPLSELELTEATNLI